jgi:hypothetical protein
MLVIPVKLVAWQFMTIPIEDAETLEYLTHSGTWTKKADEGKSFGATRAAFEVAKKELIGKFNIVYYAAGTKQLINLDHGRGKGTETTETSAV